MPELRTAEHGLALPAFVNSDSVALIRLATEAVDEWGGLPSDLVDDDQKRDRVYKRWVRNLHHLGLILRIPSEWEAPKTSEGKSPA
jgi:hypothetical protein